jgi:large repetitive protein
MSSNKSSGSSMGDSLKSARAEFQLQCSSCHGVNGANGPSGSLNGLHLRGDYTLESLIAKISTTMPRGKVGSCIGNTAGTCAFDIATMILSNQWLPPENCTTNNCSAGDSLDGRNLRLLTKEEYLNSVRDVFSIDIDAAVMSSVPSDGTNRNFNTASFLALDIDRTLGYQVVGSEIAKQVIASKSFFSLVAGCGTAPNCVVTALGKKIFRRPLSSLEIDRYSALYEMADAGKAVLQAMLISPNFLYRSEMGVLEKGELKGATGLYRLTNYEIATLLSYSLWVSAPDDALLVAAAQPVFDIKGQVTRMLNNTTLSERGLRRFAQGWFINSKYGFGAISSPTLANAFNEETIRFVIETIKADLPFSTLLTADYTYANAELAQYYGSAPVSNGWAKSAFSDTDPRRGSGVLGHGSFLASRVSSSENPSPIKRGLYVRDVLMCQELPPPQKAGLSIPKGPNDSNRDANAKHTSDPACQSCHQYIDGIGFGFERYGTDARYRTQEKLVNNTLQDIVADGWIKSLNSLETLLDPNSKEIPYRSVPELAKLIADSRQGEACYSRQFYRYLVGRNEVTADEKIIPVYSAKVRAGGGMKEMLIDLTTNPSFILRHQ